MPGAGAATRGGPGGATFPGGAPAGAIFTGPSGSGGPAEVPPGVTITREEGAEYPRGKMPGGRPGVVSPGVQITYEKGPAYPSGGLGETRVTAPGAPEHPGGAPAGVTLAGEGRPTAPGGVPSVTYTEAARKASAGKGAEFGVPVMVRVGGAGGGPTEVPTGLDEAEALARQHEQDGVNELGQRLARGATQFHTAPAVRRKQRPFRLDRRLSTREQQSGKPYIADSSSIAMNAAPSPAFGYCKATLGFCRTMQ